MATDKETGVRTFGIEALKPDISSRCVISYPVRPAVKADKVCVIIDYFKGVMHSRTRVAESLCTCRDRPLCRNWNSKCNETRW